MSLLITANPVTAKDIFSQTYVDTSKDPVTMPVDALALSCCAWRLGQANNTEYGFQSEHVKENLLPEDFEHAELVRKYYSKKIVWSQLNGKQVSPFRAELLAYLHNDPKVISESICGMIYRLPFFYQEDQVIDRLMSQADVSPLKVDLKFESKTKSLKPMEITKRRSKRDKSNNYWFLDEDRRLCSITVAMPNPLEHLWLDLFDSSAIIKITGRYVEKHREQNSFYQILNWKMEK